MPPQDSSAASWPSLGFLACLQFRAGIALACGHTPEQIHIHTSLQAFDSKADVCLHDAQAQNLVWLQTQLTARILIGL